MKESESLTPGKLLREFFKELAKLDVLYCVMNNYEQMPAKIPSDVDIAIEIKWFKKLDELLANFAIKQQVVITQKIWSGYQQYSYMLSPQKISAKFQFQLDFFVDFNMPKLPLLLLSKDLLVDRKVFNCFYVPTCEIEATFLLMRRIVKVDLTSVHLCKLKILIAFAGNKIIKKWVHLFGEKDVDRLCRYINNIDVEKARELLADQKGRIEKISSQNQSISFKGHYLLSQINRGIDRIRAPVGSVVVLMAPDGGGKTTIGNELVELISGNYQGVIRLYWRPRLLPTMGKLAFWNPREEATTNPKPHSHLPQNSLKSIIRYLYYMLDFWLGFWFKIYPFKVKKKLVIFDRYYYDFLVDLRRYQIDIPSWVPRFFLPTISTPDFIICLDADATEIFKRKQELTLNEIERQRKKILELVPLLKNTHIINTDRSIKEVVEDIASIIIGKKGDSLRCRLGLSKREKYTKG